MRNHANSSTAKSPKKAQPAVRTTKNIRVDLTHLDGDIMFPRQCIRLHFRHHGGNRATAGGQRGIGTLHHALNSDFFVPDERFSLAGDLISQQSTGEGVNSTSSAHTFFSCAQLVSAVVRVSCPVVVITGTHPRTCVGQGRKAPDCSATLCPAQNRHASSRNAIRYTSLEHLHLTSHVHSFLDTDTTYLIFLRSSFPRDTTLRRSTST